MKDQVAGHECLVSLGCYNRMLYTGWLINNRNLFFAVLEARSPRSRNQQIRCLVRAWFIDSCLLSMSSYSGRGKGTLWDLFYKHTNPIHLVTF